ncbi:MAG: UbiD family decarboxylase [Deltaproteobacteria bacterium]|nr:MAG: UbiD family decarboxylase [Deltaproteobacteria bacterium]
MGRVPADLREFLSILEAKGDLKRVEGADWDLEIGAINEMMAERRGPALLFDRVKGYPPGFRIATNILHRADFQKIAFGIPEELGDLEAVKYWKEKWEAFVPVPPKEVDRGPIMENIMEGEEVDLLKFPVPKWHFRDGGRYIGTGVVTITRDPEEGWVNLGTYRVMVHDSRTLSFYASPGKHATIMREKYWARGEECPVVMCFGGQPLLFGVSTMALPWGVSELEMTGHLQGKPVEVITGPETGLPIPATAEIAIEGFSPPPEVEGRPEGPFGEWTGYYASGRRNEPVVRVKRVYFRQDPILHGQPPIKPPVNTWFPIPLHTAVPLWIELEKLGIPDIRGVYVHGPGNRVVVVISLRQRYLGHAKQVAALAGAILQGGACTGRYIITVDEDIDPSNWEEVLWAVCTRCDPQRYIDIVPGFLTSPLDPMLPPEKRERRDFTTAKVLINACRPYHWKDRFPPVNRAPDELRERVKAKFPELFG